MGTATSHSAFIENFKLICDQEPETIDDSVWVHLLKNVCEFEDLVSSLSCQEILELRQSWPKHLQLLLEKSALFIRRMTKGELHFEVEICDMCLRVLARLMPVMLAGEDEWMWTEDAFALKLVEALTCAAFTYSFAVPVASEISPYGSS